MTDNYKDPGCEEASEYLETKSLCIQCPFSKCIKEMAASDRVLLRNAQVIKSLYKCFDMGMDKNQIGRMFGNIPKSTVVYWLKRREEIEAKIVNLESIIKPEKKKRRPDEPIRRQQRTFATQGILPI